MQNNSKIGNVIKIIFISLVLLFSTVLFFACQKEQAAQPGGSPASTTPAIRRTPSAASLAPASPQVRDFVLASSYTGEIKAVDKIDLTSKTSGRIKEIKVDVGYKVKKGDLLVVLEHDTADIEVKQKEAALELARLDLSKTQEGSRKEEIAKAEASLKAAQAALDLLLAGAAKEKIASAKAKVDSAQASLDSVLAGATAEQIQEKISGITSAEVKLSSVDIDTARTLQTTRITDNESLDYAINTRNAQLALYQAALQVAKDQLASLKAPPTPSKIAVSKADVDYWKAQLDELLAPPKIQDVAQKESEVAKAKEELELKKNPNRIQDLEILRIKVQQAQAALDLAKFQRDDAFLYAPFGGIVSTRIASEGALASPSVPIISIISSDIQVSVAIEEAAAGKVKLDQVWDIKVLAYQDRTFKGRVKAISPALNPATRTFDLLLAPQDTNGLLLPGMFVTATLPQ